MILNWLTTAFIALSCLAYQSGESFGVAQLNVFKFGAPIIMMAGLISVKRQVSNKWLMALLGWCLLTFFLLKDQPQMIAIMPLIYVVMAVGLYFTLANSLETIKPVLDGICWAVGFQAVIVLLQLLHLDPICMNDNKTGMNTALVGLYGFKYVYAVWMALATPVLLFNKRWFFGILSFLMCISSMCLAPIGLMFASLVIGVAVYRRKLLVPCLLATLLIGIVAWIFVLGKPSNQALLWKFQLRWILETKFLPVIAQKPIAGWGLGSFKYIGSSIWNPNTGTYGTMVDGWSWLEQIVELGITFVVLFAGLCWDTFKRFMGAVKTKELVGVGCALLIIPFEGLAHQLLIHPSLVVLMICLLASFEVVCGKSKL